MINFLQAGDLRWSGCCTHFFYLKFFENFSIFYWLFICRLMFTSFFRSSSLLPGVSFGSIRFFSRLPCSIRKLSRLSLRCSMLSWPLCPHSGMIKLEKFKSLISMRCKTTVKTSNYFTKISFRKNQPRAFKLSRTVISLPFSVLENARIGKKICL